MTKPKEYLGQIQRYSKLIDNKLVEIYQLRSLASSISVATDRECVQTSKEPDKIGNAVVKILQKEEELSNLIAEYIVLKTKIIGKIEGIKEHRYYDLLFKRYVEDKTFDVIAEEMGYSWRQVMNIHSSALKKFEEMYHD